MKRPLVFLATFGLLTLGAFDARAQTSRELLDRLTTKLQANVEAAKSATPPPEGSPANTPGAGDFRGPMFFPESAGSPANHDFHRPGFFPQNFGSSSPQSLLSKLNSALFFLHADQQDTAIQQLEDLKTNATDPAVRDASEAVIQKLRTEQTEKEAAMTREVNDILKRAGEAVMKAKDPKDLDAALAELSREADNPAVSRAFPNRNEPFTNRLRSAARFVGRFQDCLVFLGHHDKTQAADTLRAMLSDNGDAIQAMGVPRTEIINRIPATGDRNGDPDGPPKRSPAEYNADLAAALDRLHTLDDLPAAIRTLTALHDEMQIANRNFSPAIRINEITNCLTRLHALETARANLQQGLGNPQDSWFIRNENSGDLPQESVMAVLRAQLIALSLPRLLGAPDTEKPAAGERVDDFLNRLIDEAKKRNDWHAVERGLKARRQLTASSSYDGGYSAEETAFKEFFAAGNYEQAAQYPQAVAAYLSALGGGGQDLPVALISERLEAIKKAHPHEYAQGSRATLPGGYVPDEETLQVYRQQMREAKTAATTPPPATPSPTPSPAAAPAASPAASP